MNIYKIEHLDRIKLNDVNNKYIEITNKSIEYANKVCSVFGGSFSNNAMDLYIKRLQG